MTDRILPQKITLYVLRDPISKEVRYVGVTRNALKYRLSQHISNAPKPNQKHPSARWIRELRAQNLVPLIEALRQISDGESWRDAETAAISELRSAGANLLNVRSGGEGTIDRDWRPNDEQRAHLSAAGMGKTQSEETQKKRSSSLRKFYEDPDEMAKRVAIAAMAARSPGGRAAASARMAAIWADPVRSEQMRQRMRGAKKRNAEQNA